MKNKIMFQSLGHAVAVVVYIIGVVLFISNIGAAAGGDDGLWAPFVGLTLLVLSAAVMGALVLGRPILLYLDGSNAEAVQFFKYTLGWLFLLFVLVVALRIFW